MPVPVKHPEQGGFFGSKKEGILSGYRVNINRRVKNMKKKLLSYLLIICMVVTMLPLSTFEVSGASNVIYTWPTENHTLSDVWGDNVSGHLYDSHYGIDISGKYRTKIYAAAPGVVFKAGWTEWYGYRVLIKHDNGQVTLYAHCSSIAKGIKAGKTVKRTQLVGYMGSGIQYL